MNRENKSFNITFSIINILILICAVFLIVLNSDKGLDITDESHYLLYALHPEQITSSVSSFGYYTNILLTLTNNNLALFRIFGIAILLFATFWLMYYFCKVISEFFEIKLDIYMSISLYSVVLASSLALYKWWLITPSYNWLTLIAVILVAIGILKLLLTTLNYSLLQQGSALFLISLGGFLAFMSKPTSALILMIMTLAFVIYRYKKINIKLFFVVPTISLAVFFLLHIIFFEDDIVSYYQKILNGLELIVLLGNGYTITQLFIDTFSEILFKSYKQFNFIHHTILLSLVIVFLFITIAIKKEIIKLNSKVSLYFLFTFFTSLYLMAVFYFASQETKDWYIADHLWLIGLEFLIIVCLFSTLFLKLSLIKVHSTDIRNGLVLIGLLLFASLAYTFGTGMYIMKVISGSFLFIVMAILVNAILLDKAFNKNILTHSVSVLLSLLVLKTLIDAYHTPYRLESPISQQVHKIKLLNGMELKVSNTNALYFNTLISSAKASGWSEQIPFIDLSGGTPGASLALNASIVTTPWFLGGYPGSENFAKQALTNANKITISNAWILTAKDGKRAISTKIFKEVNISFPTDYKLVKVLKTAHRDERQELWMPKNKINIIKETF